MKISRKSAKWSLAALMLVCVAGTSLYFLRPKFQESTQVLELVSPEAPVEDAYPHEILPRTSLYTILRNMEIPSPVIHQIVEAAKSVTDLGSLRAGTRFQTFFSGKPTDELVGIKFRFSPVEKVEVKKVEDRWVAEKISIPVETKVVTFQGVVTTTLWESAEVAQMDPNLIADLAEIFAWQVDFAREVRPNDRWRLSVEQKLVKGKPYAWGVIRVAEYQNSGQLHSAILYQTRENERGYYAPDGSSLRRMFLKSPLRYGRISSRFSKGRFHPILKTNRPHLGVDYAAPVGTPIRAVGDGVVTFAAWRGGAGKAIQIHHNSTYKTAYKHLSGFAKGVRSGARVQQGQVIGYVGSTGLSTGPHLHFEFFQNGRFVDPLGRKFPTAEPIPQPLLGQFKEQAPQVLAALPPWDQISVSMLGPAEAKSKSESKESF